MIQPLKELSDEALLANFKATKDNHYFQSLVACYQNRLYNTAFRIVGNVWEAEEIVQETFIRALRNINNFRTNASFSAWLYTITHNLCVDILRLRRRKKLSLNKSFDPQSLTVHEDIAIYNKHVVTQAADRLPGPAEQLELAERREVVAHSLDYLSEQQRAVVVLRDIEGFSYQEIATITGVNIGTVRSRLHYGRGKLKVYYKNT